MTNFQIMKKELDKCDNLDDFIDTLETWRYIHFTCEDSNCTRGRDECFECYYNWLKEEVE